MSTPLPVIRGTSSALYPFTQRFVCFSSRSDAQAAKTARCVTALPIVEFELGYNPMRQSDKDTLKTAFINAIGEFSTNLSLTTDISYTNLSFESDDFSATETGSTLYGAKWLVRQTLAQGFSTSSSGGAYPTLTGGAICQRPYTQGVHFQTIISRLPIGPKYVRSEFGGGLTNFPTGPLRWWEFDETVLSDAEVTSKINHFLSNWGDVFPFTFTDEDGVTYSNIFYTSAVLEIERMMVNQSRIVTRLLQMN